jgi:hypothetical protein
MQFLQAPRRPGSGPARPSRIESPLCAASRIEQYAPPPHNAEDGFSGRLRLARSSHTLRSEATREAGRFKAREGVSPQVRYGSRTHPERNAEDAGLPQAAAEGV